MSQNPILPRHISLEQQKKRARDLLLAHKEKQLEAAVRLRAQLREFAALDDQTVFATLLTLQLCQLVLAREHGYSSWPAFKRAIETQAKQEDATTALRDAIDRDDGEATQRLVAANPGLLSEAVFDGGPTGYFKDYRPRPLVYGLQYGRINAVKAVLTVEPALATAPDEDGHHPIDLIFKTSKLRPGVSRAPNEKRVELYNLLKERGAVPNLEAALSAGDTEYVLAAIERDPANIHYERADYQWNLLVMAANAGSARIVATIMARERPTEETISAAVERAAFSRALEVLKLLLPLATQQTKDTALCYCSENFSQDSARLLIEHGANVNGALPGDRPWSVLAIALCTYSRKPWRGEYIDFLVTAGARRVTPAANATELEDVDGPVMAFFRGRFDLLESLFKRDPSFVHRRCSLDEEWAVYTPINGGTLLHFAMEYLDLPMAEWLVAHGADVNARAATKDGHGDGTGHTPLFQAVRACDVLYGPAGGTETAESLVAWLLERGADPNLRATICNQADVANANKGKIIRDVTPLGYWRAMSDREARRKMANDPVVKLLLAAGGL